MAQNPCCKYCGLQLNDLRVALSPLPTSIENSDSPLTPQDKDTIKEQLAHIQEGLDAFDEAIETLRKERAGLERERAKRACVISPIRVFPPELLFEIFTTYSESWWESMDASDLRDELGGWKWVERAFTSFLPAGQRTDWALSPMRVVSQVCRRWRTAAYACSALWSQIYLPELETHGDLNTTQKLLLDQLKFSSNHPLNINTSAVINARILEHITLISQYIIPTHRRWMHIRIMDENLRLFPKPNPGVLPLFPLLTSLRIDLGWEDNNIFYEMSAVNAPLLTEASFNWITEPAFSGRLQLPWAQMRKIQLWRCGGDTAFEIVRELQYVEELGLFGVQHSHLILSAPQELIALPFLRCLRVSDVGCKSFSSAELLSRFRLPALKILSWTQMNSDSLLHLNAMLRNTWPDGNPALAELYLHSPHGAMHECPLGADIYPLAQLLDSILPQVKIIEIGYPSPSGFHLGYVIACLRTFLRAGSASNLRALELRGVILDSWSITNLLVELKQHNIDIRLVKCAFDTSELCEGLHIFDMVHNLQRSSFTKGHLELDFEGPDSKRLRYSPQSGPRIEETCRCLYGSGT